MAKNIVTAGDYKGKAVMNPTGKPYISVGFRNKIYLNPETVAEYQVVDEDTRKSAGSGIARGIVGGALLGPVGMLAGGLSAKNKSTVTVAIQFKRPLVQIQSLGPKVTGNQQKCRFHVTFLYAKNQKKCVRIWPIAYVLHTSGSLRRVLIELTIIQNLNSFLSPPP